MDVNVNDQSLTVRTQGPLETEVAGKILGALLRPGDVVSLIGDLGTGKTCFTRGIAAGVGVDPGVAVVSPSYTILNEYGGDTRLYHFDFYRLETAPEDFDLEWREYFYGDGVVVIEWGGKVEKFLPEDHLKVQFSFLDDELHEIRLLGTGGRSLHIVGQCTTSLRSHLGLFVEMSNC